VGRAKIPVLFISHSSKDDAIAKALEAWLCAKGFTDIFIDHTSIVVGEKWAQALREASGTCRVVACLVTQAWLASDECFGEYKAAWYLGKRIIPLFLLSPKAKLDADAKKRFADLDPASGDGLLTFTLKDEFLPVFARLRIRAIGLSYQIDAPADTAARLRSITAVVIAPRAENLFSPGSQRARPPVVIERVGLYDPLTPPNMYMVGAVQNIDPREDQWQIQVSSSMMWADGASHGRAASNIRDIKLHLKLSAIYANKDTASWTALNW
jgi:hypothetical protein